MHFWLSISDAAARYWSILTYIRHTKCIIDFRLACIVAEMDLHVLIWLSKRKLDDGWGHATKNNIMSKLSSKKTCVLDYADYQKTGLLWSDWCMLSMYNAKHVNRLWYVCFMSYIGMNLWFCFEGKHTFIVTARKLTWNWFDRSYTMFSKKRDELLFTDQSISNDYLVAWPTQGRGDKTTTCKKSHCLPSLDRSISVWSGP